MTFLLSGIVLVAIWAPHLARLTRVSSTIAVAIWVSVLALRALGVIFAIAFVVLFVPATEPYRAATRWCWHAILPFLAAHLGLSGQRIGDGAVIATIGVIVASVLSVLWAVWRTDRDVRAMVRTRTLGRGPEGSLIIAGSQVVVGVAGLSRHQIVVSAGALVTLDDAELAASLEHERGHVVRRHRYLLLFAEVCRALARFLPGSRAATRELAFHLERNADEYALAHQHDPLALASAICKAATSPARARPGVARLGGEGVAARLRILAGPQLHPSEPAHRAAWVARLAATTMIVLTVSLTAALPPALALAIMRHVPTPRGLSCPT